MRRVDRRAFADAESLYSSLRPWLLAREEDSVLIVPPNRVYKLNPTAFKIFAWMDAGGRLADIPGMDEAKRDDVLRFFGELKAASDGRDPGFERVPFDFDFTRLPILGEIALTYRCNNACLFCYAGCNDGACRGLAASTDGELDTAGFKKIIDVFKRDAKIPFFSFTGGEPLLRGDLEELAAYAVATGLRINLITNGTLATDERARSLSAAGIKTAQVSLESPDEATHDRLCGARGAFSRTLAGIEALRSAGISVQTNTTVTRENRESLERLPAFVRSLGVERFSMNIFIPARDSPNADALFVPYGEIGDVVDLVRKRAFEAGVTFFWYSPTPFCIYNPVARGLGNKNCAAVDGLISVSPTGDILPCSSYDEAIGNLIKRPFAEVWFSERAAWFKNKRYAPERCASCDAFGACQAACPLYWDYAGYGELESREVFHGSRV